MNPMLRKQSCYKPANIDWPDKKYALQEFYDSPTDLVISSMVKCWRTLHYPNLEVAVYRFDPMHRHESGRGKIGLKHGKARVGGNFGTDSTLVLLRGKTSSRDSGWVRRKSQSVAWLGWPVARQIFDLAFWASYALGNILIEPYLSSKGKVIEEAVKGTTWIQIYLSYLKLDLGHARIF